ncbi:MAG TPA: AMP-binding protein [Dehalococcoidia bacterium]|nr:AMP-binding protein [Dehalococcoidia bacterium]
MPDPTTIPAVLRATAQAHRDRVALVEKRAGDLREVDFGRLREHVEALAGGLLAHGIYPGDKVALISPNSQEWVVAFLAILRAGAVAVPLYSGLAPGEVQTLLKASHSRLVLAPDGVLGDLGKLDVPALSWPQQAPATLEESLGPIERTDRHHDLPPIEHAEPGDVAVIIYTSGTTGRPKGVMLSHHNLLSNLESFIGLVKVGPDDRLLLVLPLHHAFPLTVGLLSVISRGGSLALEHDVLQVATRMAETRPTVFFGVPALYDAVLRNIRQRIDRERGAGSFERLTGRLAAVKRVTGVNLAPFVFRPLRQRIGGRLRFMVSGGAALSPETARGFFGLGIPILQGYGLTEASPAVAAQPYSTLRFIFTRQYERLADSVGKALPGIRLALADAPEKGVRVAIQGQGELMVHGPNVMLGYYEDPEATRAVIEDGWLHTGDLARIDADGWVFITGRLKDVIVLDTGENIYPEEVEEVLGRSALLADSCLLTTGRRQKDLCVVVFVDPAADGVDPKLAGDRQALQAACEHEAGRLLQQLASYKRPGRLVLAREPLPRTLLGKVKRHEVAEHYLE